LQLYIYMCKKWLKYSKRDLKYTRKSNHRVQLSFLTVEKNSRRNDELMFSFKRKYVVTSCKCFQIAHGSLMKAVCLLNRGRCPPAAHAIWVMRSDWPEPKPHGSYVCTVGFSLIERQSSSLSTAHAVPVVILFISTNCKLNSKNVLNIANDTWNALENQTSGIMVIAYRDIFYEAKRWSHRPLELKSEFCHQAREPRMEDRLR
jgi:hypothetical protein